VAFAQCDFRTAVLGTEISIPVIPAPVSYSRLMHPGGELAAARAAGSMGTGYILATISGYKLEDVKTATSGPAWYQLYLIGGREIAEGAIERARNAGFSALVITVDTAVAGMRERDPRNGMKQLLAGNVFGKLPFLPQLFARPGWLTSLLLDGGVPKPENLVAPDKGPLPLIDVASMLARSVVTWNDISWIRQVWRGPIVVKGVLTGDDALRALDQGAAAVVVSNHGGRQLGGVAAAIQALPEVVAAVKGRAEVLMDGGVRRGSDTVKAICMGAKAVLIGRAYAYGLAAAGQAGVNRVLQIFREDIERSLRLLGCAGVKDLESSFVTFPREWHHGLINSVEA
jgi:isopentenyl diphosphate isomerase/L-lactate dehydrogenase-like FMN-dependent dehydrogenase